MTTRRNRRVTAPPPPLEEERVYTEDDYAAPDAQGLSYGEVSYAEKMDWLPTQEMPPVPEEPSLEDAPTQSWTAAPEEDVPEEEYVPIPMEGYDPMYDSETDYMDADDPLDDDLLTEEEQAELRRSQWQLLSNLADLAGIILGVGAILLLVMLLISLLNWLVGDLSQSFILLQKNF